MQIESKNRKNIYRFERLTVLELMAVLAVLGVVLTCVLHSFF